MYSNPGTHSVFRLTEETYRTIPRDVVKLHIASGNHQKQPVAKLLRGIIDGDYKHLRHLILGYSNSGREGRIKVISEDVFNKQDLHDLLTSERSNLFQVNLWALNLSKSTRDNLYQVSPISRITEIYIHKPFEAKDEKLATRKEDLTRLFTMSSPRQVQRIGSKSALRNLPPELLRTLVVNFLSISPKVKE